MKKSGDSFQDINPTQDMTTQVVASFNQSFEKGDLVDTFSQIGEIAIDQVIGNPLLKEIPVLSLLVSGYKAVLDIKSYNMTQKVIRFLYHLKETTPEQRQQFSRKYCEANQEETAAALLDILDKLNNKNYVSIVCNLIKAVIDEHLTIPQFNRLIMALQRTSYTDLLQLGNYIEDYDEEGLSDALLSSGLIYQSVLDGGSDEGENNSRFKISPNGLLMLRFGFKKEDIYDMPRSITVQTGIKALSENELDALWGEDNGVKSLI